MKGKRSEETVYLQFKLKGGKEVEEQRSREGKKRWEEGRERVGEEKRRGGEEGREQERKGEA